MLIDDVKARMIRAMREKNIIERDTLRVALGDLQTAANRISVPLSDEEAQKIIRKMIKSNDETIELVTEQEKKDKLRAENEILNTLMPQTLGVDEIVAKLQPVAGDIKAAGNDGQATGVAMKHLKPQGLAVEGKDVAEAVRKIRGQ